MVNYKELYYQLFNKMTDIIEELKEVQCQMEEMYTNIPSAENQDNN